MRRVVSTKPKVEVPGNVRHLRAYPTKQEQLKTPTELLTQEVFAPTRDARVAYRRRFGVTLSMDNIENAVRAAYRGDMRDLTDILRETVNTDPHLGSVLNKRFGSVAALPWEVQPAAGNGVDREKAAYYAEVCRTQLFNLKNFRKNLNQLAWGIFDGRACLEAKWLQLAASGETSKFGRPRLVMQTMEWIHPRRLSFGHDRGLRIEPEDAIYVGGNFADTGIEVTALPDKFVWWTPQHFNDYPEREGLGIRCMYWSFFKRFAARERMILSELFGKPWRIIEVDEESPAGSKELQAADEIVDALGATYTARMPRGTKLKVESPGAGAGQVHQEIIDESDRQISKLVLGQTGTTDGVPAGLNSSQASVMQDEQLGILLRDAGDLSELVESQITDRIIAINFGESEVAYAPRFRLRADLPADRLTELKRLQASLDAGLRVTRQEAYEVSGFSVPDEEDITVQIEQPPTPPLSPVAPSPRPTLVYPAGSSPSAGEQQPPSPAASPAAGSAEVPGSPAGAASAESTVTVNEDRIARGLDPLLLPNGQPDPRGEMTIAEFNKTIESGADIDGEAPKAATSEETSEEGAVPVSDAQRADIAKQSLNGAQVGAVLEVVGKFKLGEIEFDAAVELLVSAFPISRESAMIIIGKPLSDAEKARVAQEKSGAPPPSPATPESESADEGEESGEDEVANTRQLERYNVASEIEAGDELYGDGGIHGHIVRRHLLATALDGAHCHVFLMPDGSVVCTQMDGPHVHGLDTPESDETMDDGEHSHIVALPSGLTLKTGEDGAHSHRLQVFSTAVDGDHRHALEIPDPNDPMKRKTIYSMTSSEYATWMRARENVGLANTSPAVSQELKDYEDTFGGGAPESKSQKEQLEDYFDEMPTFYQLDIRQLPNGKYRVVSEETGRNFGEYDTLEEAQERLKQIERFATRDFAGVLERTNDEELSTKLTNACAEWFSVEKRTIRYLGAGQNQPRTVDGSTEDIVNANMPTLERSVQTWSNDFERSVRGKSDPVDIMNALIATRKELSLQRFAKTMDRGLLQSSMLGAIDSVRDLVNDNSEDLEEVVEKSGEAVQRINAAVVNAHRALLGNKTKVRLGVSGSDFSQTPYEQAVRWFEKLSVMSKLQFEHMKTAVGEFAFTAAGITADQTLAVLQADLAAAIRDGDDLRLFWKRITPRLEDAGFLSGVGKLKDGSQALNPSHLQTVFRTNTQTTYGSGRYLHQTDPQVLRAFPVWEVRVVKDDRTRQSHRKLAGKRFRADDPFWKTAYPPFGFNCRCRVVSKSKKYLDRVDSTADISDLPDPGFVSGTGILPTGS